jgi:hypothetical protein
MISSSFDQRQIIPRSGNGLGSDGTAALSTQIGGLIALQSLDIRYLRGAFEVKIAEMRG